MSLEAVTCTTNSAGAAIAASFNAMSSGGCSHGAGCLCGVGSSVGGSYTVMSWTCFMCGTIVYGNATHSCTGSPGLPGVGIGTSPCVPNIFPNLTLPECALCDKILEYDDKKVCKECRGVFEAWKFLTKIDKPEEDEGGSEG